MKKENLHNINKAGFKTPDNYFESFEADFLELLNEKESINASENSGFTVPINYFDSVENNVLEKLNTQPEKPVINIKSRQAFYYVAGIAASFALLFSLVFNNSKDLTFDALETSSLESYLYQEEYSSDDFATLFNSDELSETDFINLNVSDETFYEYLEDTDTEDYILD